MCERRESRTTNRITRGARHRWQGRQSRAVSGWRASPLTAEAHVQRLSLSSLRRRGRSAAAKGPRTTADDRVNSCLAPKLRPLHELRPRKPRGPASLLCDPSNAAHDPAAFCSSERGRGKGTFHFLYSVPRGLHAAFPLTPHRPEPSARATCTIRHRQRVTGRLSHCVDEAGPASSGPVSKQSHLPGMHEHLECNTP